MANSTVIDHAAAPVAEEAAVRGAGRVGARAGTRVNRQVLERLGNEHYDGAKIIAEARDGRPPLHLAEDTPTAVEKFNDSNWNMALWQIPMLGTIGGFIGGIGKKLDKIHAGAPFNYVAKKMKAGQEFLEEKTIGSAVNATRRTAKSVRQRFGGGHEETPGGVAVETEMPHVGGAEPPRTTLRQNIEGRLESVGDHIDNALDSAPMKPVKWLRDQNVKYHQRRASGEPLLTVPLPKVGKFGGDWRVMDSHGNKAKLAHDRAHGHIDAAIDKLQEPHFRDVKAALESTKQGFTELHTAETLAGGEKNAHLSHILEGKLKDRAKILETGKADFDKASTSVLTEMRARHAAVIKAEKAAGASSAAIGILEKQHRADIKGVKSRLREADKKFNGSMFSDSFAKDIAKSQTHLLNQVEGMERVAFRQNFKEGLKNIPDRLMKVNGTTAINKGLYYAAQGATAIRTAKLFTNGVDVLKHMEASITGEDISKISTRHVLFGKVPHAMEEARHQYMKSSFPQAAANLVGMAAFAKLMSKGATGKTMVLGMGAQVVAGMAGGMIAEQNSLLDAYATITRAQEAGQQIPAGAYLALLVHASKDVRGMDQEDPRLLAVAKQYADEKVTAGFVLKELDDGAFKKRIAALPSPEPKPLPEAEQAKLKNEIAEGSKKMTVSDGEQAHIQQRAEAGRAKIEQAEAGSDKPVVGNFSAKIAGENRGAAATTRTAAAVAPTASHVEAIQKNDAVTASAVR